VAIGIEVILGALCVANKRPLKDIHILDAGRLCTCTYT